MPVALLNGHPAFTTLRRAVRGAVTTAGLCGSVAMAAVLAGMSGPPPGLETIAPGAAGPAVTRPAGNPPYRGEFVFTRIRYGSTPGARGFRRGGSRWSHDYPRADVQLSRLLHELSTARVHLEGTNVYVLDDPDLFRYPLAYISEPGFWTMSESEATALRAYVLKGGFLIFDDFEREQWDNLAWQLDRVFPEYRPIRIEVDHPIFHAFFDMKSIYFPHPLVNVMPTYYGVFEGNDPTQRMLAIINYNNDIAEYWEWSNTGWLPVDITNEAYKLGVNYVVYALTH